jgi:hypothetical protein
MRSRVRCAWFHTERGAHRVEPVELVGDVAELGGRFIAEQSHTPLSQLPDKRLGRSLLVSLLRRVMTRLILAHRLLRVRRQLNNPAA